jgi:putative tryptophan/tyrosine transport system substrate-binding protein
MAAIARRKLLAALGGAAVWPLAARAQQPAMPLIGFLAAPSAGESRSNLVGFRQGLRQAGYVEGQNVHIAFRWAEGRYDRFPEMAAELVDLPVAVIVAFSGPAALAAIAATKTIPIVFSVAVDPVELGLVTSFNRPGGNATGVANLAGELVGKQFELMHEMLPAATVMGLLVNPNGVNAKTQLAAVPVAMQAFGLRIVVQNAGTDRDFEIAFAGFAQERTGALVVASDPFFYGRREQLVALAGRHALPAIYYDREYVTDGGLMSYGPSITDAYRQAGVFTGRILKGDKPGDLPVQQAVKIELVTNVKTAKALSIDIPLSLLLRINEAIE